MERRYVVALVEGTDATKAEEAGEVMNRAAIAELQGPNFPDQSASGMTFTPMTWAALLQLVMDHTPDGVELKVTVKRTDVGTRRRKKTT